MKETKAFLVYLPENIKEAVEKLSIKRGISQGAVFRVAITKLLEEENVTCMDWRIWKDIREGE